MRIDSMPSDSLASLAASIQQVALAPVFINPMIPRVKAELWTTKAMRSIIFQKNFWLWRQALLPSLDAGWRANDTHTCKSFTTGSSSNWEHRCALRCWFQGCEDVLHALGQ